MSSKDGKSTTSAYVDNPDPTYQTHKLCTYDDDDDDDAENPEILDVAFYQHKVAVSGDVMVIGSAWEKIADQCDGGAAHVYARTPITDDGAHRDAQGTAQYAWTHVQKITSRDVFDHANEFNTRNFGHAVAVDKDTIVVSHYVGRYVNVYTRSDPNDPASLWTLRAKLEVPSLTMTDTYMNLWTEGFGYAVAVDGDTVVVSQPGAHAEGDDHEARRRHRGAVHVFTRDVPNDLTSTWRYVSRLSTDAFDDFAFVGQQTLFGQTVAIDGDVIVVGTDSAEGDTTAEDIGKTTTRYPSECTGVHVFVRQSPGDLASKFKWIQVVDSQWGWTDADGGMRCEPEFGKSGLAIRDGVLVVGSKAERIAQRIDREGCGGEQGAAYVFERIDPNAYDSNWTLTQKVRPPYVGCNQRGSFGWNAAIADGGRTMAISEPRASWEWDYPALTEYDASRRHASAGAVHVYTRGQDSLTAPNASWFSLKATIGQGGLDAPSRVGWTDAESNGAMFGAGVAIHEDTLAATSVHTKYFAAVFALDGVPTPWIAPEEEPGPWINRLFRDAGTTMASLVVLMGLGPSAAFAVAAVFFKPALRKFLIKHGMKRLADKIVPDLADDFRLMKIEMEEMKNFMAEQAFPRLKLGVDVHPEIAAEDIVFEPLPEGGAPDVKSRGGASFGTVQVAVVRGEKCDVNTVLPGAGAAGVPDDVAETMKKEINLISTFNHPNLVKVKGACAEKGQIVMEHCDGGTVGDKIGGDENGVSPWRRAKIASQTAAAAAYLHRQGMAHGNLSADRVQLTSDGDAKLGEYGMKKTKKKVNKLTAAAIMIGAGLAKAAAKTLEVAEAVMESYDAEAARGDRRGTLKPNPKPNPRGRGGRRRTIIAPGPVCESIDETSSDDDDADASRSAEDEPARAMRAAMTAPELLRRNGGGFGGDPKSTPAADVYALGMTLWRMYEGRGRAPFGDARAKEVRARVLAGERPGFENANVKSEVRGLIECCLKANPRQRPTAATVAVTMKKIGETESKRVETGDGVVKHEKKFAL